MSVRVRLPNPLSALDDRALLARFAEERDQPAFEQLVKRHGGVVYGVCRRAVRDGHLAEDAFQAVFLVLARHPRRAAEAASVGGWLFGVARRVGLAARRHEERRGRHSRRAEGVGALAQPSESHPTSDFDDLLRVLDEELAAMPDEPRAALVACFLRERTQDEAARELGWSLSTLRRRLERGKELLRARLARRGVTLAAGLLTSALAAPARAAVPALAESPSPTAAALAGEAARAGVSAKLLAAVAGLALVCGGVAFGLGSDCSDAPQPPTRAAAPPAVVAAAPTLAPAPAELKTWVTLSGRVAFPKGRDLPKVRIVPEGQVKDKDALNPFMPLRHEDLLIDPETRGIANAVVFLRPDADDRKAEFPKDKVHPALAKPEPVDRAVSVAGGQFAPRVLVARAGDRVTFTNLLTVPTNVLYRPLADAGDGREFNVLVLKDTSYTSKPLPALSFADCYSSTIHLWMKGYVWAFDHPYFAVTDASGRFEMPKVPAGTWRLVVWQEAVGWLGGVPGKFGRKVTVPATRTGTHELDLLTFDSDRWPE